MATLVSYDHDYAYPYDDRGARCPILQIQLTNPANPSQTVEVDAYIDSGAGGSLFDGEFASAIGIELTTEPSQPYSTTTGSGLSARLHEVIVSHPDLGRFPLRVGFSEQKIWRNLLGRDFFALIQIGFRERQSAFFVTPSP